MSEGELLRKKDEEERAAEEDYHPAIGVYEPEKVDDVKVETKLKDIYVPDLSLRVPSSTPFVEIMKAPT